MDKFSFFFAFYGLILGLAVSELLGGFASFVRQCALRQMKAQTALLALFTFVAICATWIDAWGSLQTVTLDFSGLWAPILLATAYYLAASVVFPSDPADYDRLDAYFAERKRFVIAMLLVAELLVSFTFRNVFVDAATHRPAEFWLWLLPYNLAIVATLIALWLVGDRRWNIGLLVLQILLFLVPYWEKGWFRTTIARHYGY